MDLFKYRVWCETESLFVEKWAETEVLTCPNNNSHEIDSDKTVIIESILEESPKDRSGKERVQQTSRPLGTMTYFTGRGDDPNNIDDVGNGEKFIVNHIAGQDSTSQILYLDFNCIENDTYIHEGYITWEDAKFDVISLKVVPRVVSTQISSNTNFNFYESPDLKTHLIVPAYPGTGTCEILSDISQPNNGLVYMPDSDLGVAPIAFWNADYDSTSNMFINITAAPYGNGRYNMFYQEDILVRFVNKFQILGWGFQRLQSSDSEKLGHGMRLKSTANTYGEDHNWSIACSVTMHRLKTV